MKKLLMLSSALMMFQAAPVLADHHGGEKQGKMFSEKDTNGDGMISKDEFLKHAEQKFSEMDQNADGSISTDEAREKWEAKKEEMKEKRKEWKEKRKEKMDSMSTEDEKTEM